MAKKVMICGGTGFLGYTTALEGLKRGYKIGSISLDDITLGDWFPKEIETHFLDLFEASEEEIAKLMKGYDYMIYSVGPDDRETPKAPAREFFYKHLVTDCAKVFRAAEKAGVKKAVVYNSYFSYFNELYPEAKLAETHPYVFARVEQIRVLNEQKKNMEVVVLELPYIFGGMPERMPLWRPVFLDRFANGMKTIFFPKGMTTMTSVDHIGEAGIGALEHGEDGACYPIGDENRTYNWMLDTMMTAVIGTTRKIVNPPAKICALGAKVIAKKEKKAGNEPGLNLAKVMTDIMSKNMVVPESVMDEVNAKLGVKRGGLEESIKVMMSYAYADGSFK